MFIKFAIGFNNSVSDNTLHSMLENKTNSKRELNWLPFSWSVAIVFLFSQGTVRAFNFETRVHEFLCVCLFVFNHFCHIFQLSYGRRTWNTLWLVWRPKRMCVV